MYHEEKETRNEGLEKNIEFILNSLKEHENKLNRFIEIFEEKIQAEINPEELRQYGAVSIHDKRSPHWTNYGQIIKRKIGVNGLELTTDRGYTLCLSGDCSDFELGLTPELREKTIL